MGDQSSRKKEKSAALDLNSIRRVSFGGRESSSQNFERTTFEEASFAPSWLKNLKSIKDLPFGSIVQKEEEDIASDYDSNPQLTECRQDQPTEICDDFVVNDASELKTPAFTRKPSSRQSWVPAFDNTFVSKSPQGAGGSGSKPARQQCRRASGKLCQALAKLKHSVELREKRLQSGEYPFKVSWQKDCNDPRYDWSSLADLTIMNEIKGVKLEDFYITSCYVHQVIHSPRSFNRQTCDQDLEQESGFYIIFFKREAACTFGIKPAMCLRVYDPWFSKPESLQSLTLKSTTNIDRTFNFLAGDTSLIICTQSFELYPEILTPWHVPRSKIAFVESSCTRH